MVRCGACGAALAPAAAWCGQCFAPVSAAGPAVTSAGPVAAAAGPSRMFMPAAAAPAPLVRQTRWAKTPTTFGPVGRVVATVALLVPLLAMLVGGLADPFVWGGAAVYGVVLVPWALRDIWKAGIVPVG